MSAIGSTQERIDDALVLWHAKRREGAFLMAVVAVVVRSREDFPKPMRESESFRRYIESKFATRVSVEYRGKLWPIEDIFYTWFRCEIVHGTGLPLDIGLTEGREPDELTVRAGGAPDYKLLVSSSWFHHLISWAQA
jgi:hypothetical protein